MSDPSSRRKFLQLLGLTAGTTLAGPGALGAFLKTDEIRKLNPEQKEFMLQYAGWLERFVAVSKTKKANPADAENNKALMSLTEEAEAMRPALVEHMKDDTFALVYKLSIERASREI